MIKKFCLVLVGIAAIAALVFYDQVLSVFNGMSVLESLKTIVQFVLHVTVATIATWAFYMLLEVLEPLFKFVCTLLRQKQQALRRGRFVPRTGTKQIKRPAGGPGRRSSRDAILYWMMSQLVKSRRGVSTNNGQSLPTQSEETNRIRLKF